VRREGGHGLRGGGRAAANASCVGCSGAGWASGTGVSVLVAIAVAFRCRAWRAAPLLAVRLPFGRAIFIGVGRANFSRIIPGWRAGRGAAATTVDSD